jgi:hypothetical protein
LPEGIAMFGIQMMFPFITSAMKKLLSHPITPLGLEMVRVGQFILPNKVLLKKNKLCVITSEYMLSISIMENQPHIDVIHQCYQNKYWFK